jgi:preprotein translocase subunit YajC
MIFLFVVHSLENFFVSANRKKKKIRKKIKQITTHINEYDEILTK